MTGDSMKGVCVASLNFAFQFGGEGSDTGCCKPDP